MSRALLSFLGGMGTGYLGQTEKNKDRARQERLDAQNQQLFGAKMDDINRANADRQALADAGKPVSIEEGAGGMLKSDTMDNRDVGLPENAQLPNQGLSDKAYRVAGTGYATPTEAATAKTAYEAPDAVAARTVQALRSTGRAADAMQMEASVKSGKMSDIQLNAAKVQEARDAYNNTVMDAFRTHGVFQGAAKMWTDTGAMGQAGATVEAVPSADGQTMQFYRTGADGQRTLAHQVPNTRDGEMSLITSALKLSPDKMVDWYQDSVRRATDNERWDKTYTRQGDQFTQTHAIAKRSADRQDGLADLQIKAGTLAYEKALEEYKVPTAVKLQVDALREELKQVGEQKYKAEAQGALSPEGEQKLMETQAALYRQLRSSLAPYVPKSGTPVARSAGELTENSTAQPPPKMDPIPYTSKVWDGAETAASKTTSVPLMVLRSIRLRGERSNGDQISPKGGRGVYQFTPATRDAFLKKYGVDAYSKDPDEQALAAAYHLKESFGRTGNWNQAMAGFNGGISGENGANKTVENKSYAERTRIGGIPATVPNPF